MLLRLGRLKVLWPTMTIRKCNHRKCVSVNCSLPIWIINFFMCTTQGFLMPTRPECVTSLTVFSHQALLHWLHKSSCTSSPWIVQTCYRLTSPVTLKQFISITKNPTGIGNVSNNKIPVKSSKSHWRLWSTCHKSPLASRAPGHFRFWSEIATNSLLAES